MIIKLYTNILVSIFLYILEIIKIKNHMNIIYFNLIIFNDYFIIYYLIKNINL